MRKQLLWALILIAGAIAIAGLLVWLKPAPVEEERVDQVPLVQGVALEAAAGPIPVLGSGLVQAREEVTVGAQVSGRLTYVNPAFREGGRVGKGTVLLRIDPSDYQNQVRTAQAEVAAQDVAVLQAEEEVAIARDELSRFAEREKRMATRQSGTGGSRILPPDQIEQALAARVDPAEAPETTGEETPAAERTLATREPQLQSAKASQEGARARLADAQLLLGRTRITAPFGGLVREENAAVGSLVQPGQALGTIVSTSAYEVRVSLTADEAALVPGLLSGARSRIPASVTYEYGGQLYRWDAFVDRANAILDSATRNIEVFLRVPAPLSGGKLVGDGETPGRGPPLLLGAFVEAEITGAVLESYAAIPATAVRPGNEIWVVRDGKLQILPVRVIQRSDAIAYIATPTLSEGGLVVTNALPAPIAGMDVRIAQPAKSAQSQD